jgi:plasmid stability protein
MKNITLSVDDETYRRARILAAERGTSVSALVREYLQTLSGKAASKTEEVDELFAALDRAQHLRASERLSRDEAHAR